MNKACLYNAMYIAEETANKSSCLKRKVGCVVVDLSTGLVEATGFNSATEPCKKCLKKKLVWNQDSCYAIHAEVQAIFNFIKDNTIDKLKNKIVVCTLSPCDQCLKYLHHFGVSLVVYKEEKYSDFSKWENKIKVQSLKEYLC